MKIKIAQNSIGTTTLQVAIQTKPNQGSKPHFLTTQLSSAWDWDLELGS